MSKRHRITGRKMDFLPDNLFFDARWEPEDLVLPDGQKLFSAALVVTVENRSKSPAKDIKVQLARLPAPCTGFLLSGFSRGRSAEPIPQLFEMELPLLNPHEKVAVHPFEDMGFGNRFPVTMQMDEPEYIWRIPHHLTVQLPSGHTYFQSGNDRASIRLAAEKSQAARRAKTPSIPMGLTSGLYLFNAGPS